MKLTSSSWNELENLVLVAGHAVYVGVSPSAASQDESWIIKHFQKGEAPHYIAHIRFGVELAASMPSALLVFSGGQTRLEAGPWSEAQSYWQLAEQFDWWSKTEVRCRATTEEYARDSFENLLLGIARFRESCGHYPLSIDIVGWDFKRRRFDFHRQTIKWPVTDLRYRYHGINNPDRIDISEKREEMTMASFRSDPFGNGKCILNKRAERNPFRRQSPYAVSCPEIASLLSYQASEGQELRCHLPWESRP
ncbi:MAG: hypothetical protein C4576_17730 [Desulfobacteraceae bacterium]|nr:MAG: hypothetical protein C4576_17730 [Desulfobacteraceae bacterium]